MLKKGRLKTNTTSACNTRRDLSSHKAMSKRPAGTGYPRCNDIPMDSISCARCRKKVMACPKTTKRHYGGVVLQQNLDMDARCSCLAVSIIWPMVCLKILCERTC